MTTSVPLGDEALVALVRRCLLTEDPVPAAVVDRALAVFERRDAMGRHPTREAGSYPGAPAPRPRGGDPGFL